MIECGKIARVKSIGEIKKIDGWENRARGSSLSVSKNGIHFVEEMIKFCGYASSVSYSQHDYSKLSGFPGWCFDDDWLEIDNETSDFINKEINGFKSEFNSVIDFNLLDLNVFDFLFMKRARSIQKSFLWVLFPLHSLDGILFEITENEEIVNNIRYLYKKLRNKIEVAKIVL